jgi:hypothetical protein
VIPDGQKIVSDYLRGHSLLSALDLRIVGHPPENTDDPWVFVLETAAPERPNLRGDHVVDFWFDLNCYAGVDGGLPEVVYIKRAVREAINQMPASSHDGAVVSRTKVGDGMRLDDPHFDPPRERYVLSAMITMHS